MENVMVYKLASECDSLFRKAVSEAALPSNAQLPLHGALFHCQSRFDTWASYTNALEDGETSLDQQLEFSPGLQSAVVGLLELIRTSLQKDLVSGCEAQELKLSRSDEYQAAKYRVLQAIPPSLTRIYLTAIHEAIDILQRISDTKIRDEEGFDRVAAAVVKGAYPDLPETLVQQLGSSIARRRARLLRQRKHQQGLDLHRQQGDDAQAVAAEDTQSVAQAQDQMVAALDKLSVTEHPVLEPKKLSADASTQQKVGSGTTTASSAALSYPYPYPEPPTPLEGVDHVRCDWCSKQIRAGDPQRRGWWESHFDQDLQPYTCISESCQKPPLYFASMFRWQEHMKEMHTAYWTENIHRSRVWYCDLHLDEEVHVMYEIFQNEESLRQHLEADHKDLSSSEIDTKVRRNTRRPCRSQNICLFCGFDARPEVDTDRERGTAMESSTRYATLRARKARDLARLVLWNHIAQHLKSLAFISRRWCEDEKVDAEGSDVQTNAASIGGSSEDEEAASVAG